MAGHMLYLVAQTVPLDSEPMPEGIVVAAISTDVAVMGKISPRRQLELLADKLGIRDYEIQSAAHLQTKGVQLNLPLPNFKRARSHG